MAEPSWSLIDGMLVYRDGRVRIQALKAGDAIVASPCDDGRFVLREWSEYKLKGQGITEVWQGDLPAKQLDDGLFLLVYQNAVGLGRVEIRMDDGSAVDLGVDIVSRKLVLDDRSHPLYQPRFLKSLLEAIAKHLADGAFDAFSATGQRTAESSKAATDLFLLHFLRVRGEELGEGIRGVLASPHRVLQRFEQETPAAKAHQVNEAGIAWSLGRSLWARAATGGVWRAPDDTQYSPLAVLASYADETFDTPENRFILFFAHQIQYAIRRIRPLATKHPELTHSALADLQDNLGLLLGDERLQDVPESNLLPVHSQVLLHRPGYEQLYRLYPAFLAGREVLEGVLGQAVALRNIAELYEIWCFFELASDLAQALGDVGPDSPRFKLRAGHLPERELSASATFLHADYRLVYQQTFVGSGHAVDGRSYSVNFVPDFALFKGRQPIGVFDAKFRLRWASVDQDAGTTADGKPVEDDLHKMHAYRDALGLRFAVAVYPGDCGVFYRSDGADATGPPTLAALVSDDALEGIGALSLRPGGTS
ncbi:MAG: DUF2357 domain-containing protein [Dehalococcoidales bacterium]|nr:DUF2357 domain-containing protein [Dehalococcoidales bacterium]